MIKKNLLILLFSTCFVGAQTRYNIQMSSLVGTVNFVVTDKWSKKTGFDPRGSGIFYEEIPKANYSTDGVGDELPNNVFLYTFPLSTAPTSFSIKLIGDKLCVFKFDFYGNGSDPQSSSFQKTIKSLIDKDAEMTYTFICPGEFSNTATVEKVISISTLGQDFTTAGKLNLVGNQTYINNVITKINQMVNFYHSGNKANAHNKLNDIKAQIQSSFFNPSLSQFVDEYAYAVLLEDIQLTFALIDYTGPIEEMRIKK